MSKKYTLITGACGGLGKAFVYECAKNHENLVLTGTSSEKLNVLLNELQEKFKDIDIKTFVLKLQNLNDREYLIKFILENEIEVNKLINNAGVIIEGDLEKFADSEIMTAVEVNCVGTLDLTKKLLAIRIKDDVFEVLTVSSAASSYPMPHMAVYAATKSFLASVMTALAIEYKGKKVYFTTICPGAIATNSAMIESIEAMGLGGKLSSVPAEKVAKIGLKALKHRKKLVTVGKFNKLLNVVSKPISRPKLAKIVGKIWKKSQKKRGML